MKKLFFALLTFLIITPSVYGAVAAPSNFTMSNATNTTIQCTWTNNTDNADSIRILNIADSTWVASTTISKAKSLVVTGLTPGTTYNWMAWADSAGTASANSNSASLATKYPEIEQEPPQNILNLFTKALNAQSWSLNNTEIETILSKGISDKDSSTVIFQNSEYTTFYCVASGDSVDVVILFYAGHCPGPFYVAVQDSLVIESAGFYRKEVSWGADQHGYFVIESRSHNDVSVGTTISDMRWVRRKIGIGR